MFINNYLNNQMSVYVVIRHSMYGIGHVASFTKLEDVDKFYREINADVVFLKFEENGTQYNDYRDFIKFIDYNDHKNLIKFIENVNDKNRNDKREEFVQIYSKYDWIISVAKIFCTDEVNIFENIIDENIFKKLI